MTDPKIVFKPKFLGVVSILPIAINSVVGGVGLVGMVIFANHITKGSLPLPVKIGFGVLFLVHTLVIPMIAYVWKKNTYAQTEYRLFGDHLEYAEGFLNVKHKSVEFSKIQESSMVKNIIQRRYNLGTIILKTAGHTANAGIYLKDVEKPEDVYQAVKQLLSQRDV